MAGQSGRGWIKHFCFWLLNNRKLLTCRRCRPGRRQQGRLRRRRLVQLVRVRVSGKEACTDLTWCSTTATAQTVLIEIGLGRGIVEVLFVYPSGKYFFEKIQYALDKLTSSPAPCARSRSDPWANYRQCRRQTGDVELYWLAAGMLAGCFPVLIIYLN